MDFGSEVSLGKDVILIGDRDVHHGEGKVFTLYKDGEEWHKGSPIKYNYIKLFLKEVLARQGYLKVELLVKQKQILD